MTRLVQVDDYLVVNLEAIRSASVRIDEATGETYLQVDYIDGKSVVYEGNTAVVLWMAIVAVALPVYG